MKGFFLDTSIIIDYLRGKKETIERVDKIEGELSSSFLCLAELYEGIYRARNSGKLEKDVTNFFKGLDYIYGIDERIAKIFGETRANLKKQGNVLEDIDIFLAATCIENNLVMLTQNKRHFQRVEDLQTGED